VGEERDFYGVFRARIETAMKPYTSGTPSTCSRCKDYAKFKSEDGKFFYCETCARVVLRTNPEEAAAAFLRWIDSERHHGQK
jgi:ABC-type thiamine transport system substrate-binding protein